MTLPELVTEVAEIAAEAVKILTGETVATRVTESVFARTIAVVSWVELPAKVPLVVRVESSSWLWVWARAGTAWVLTAVVETPSKILLAAGAE